MSFTNVVPGVLVVSVTAKNGTGVRMIADYRAGGRDSVYLVRGGFDGVPGTDVTGQRGLEVAMGYYPVLDRMPIGRDEGDGAVLWLRRHDEYEDAPPRATT